MSHHQNATCFYEEKGLVRAMLWRRRAVFFLMLFERLWPLIIPLILLICSFFICVWLGIFSLLPFWLHIVVLALFTVIGAVALCLPWRLHLPKVEEIDHYLERRNKLAFQPLSAQSDHVVIHGEDGATTIDDRIDVILWQEHRQRMKRQLHNLKIGMPAPCMPRRDPYALRSLFFLGLAVAFSYSFHPNSGRIKDAFAFALPVSTGPSMRIDAWVNPPEYTGFAPLYLNVDVGNQTTNEQIHRVPQGSLVYFQLINAPSSSALWHEDEIGERSRVSEFEASSTQQVKAQDHSKIYQFLLDKQVSLQLVAPPFEKKWFFSVIEDEAVRIDWSGEPRRALGGVLELPYKIDDDYGAIRAWAEIRDFDSEQDEHLALYEAPQIELVLPHSGKGEAKTRYDLTNHPWAGMEIGITLYAEDGGGHIAASKGIYLTLPQRAFGNPLARAVVEQRRLLARYQSNRYFVADLLAALLVRPQDTIRNATHVIALQSAWTRLALAHDDDGLRGVVDYLWQIALGIESDGLEQARERLKAAQQALRDALRNGVTSDEIERLMQELRQAMQDYIAALAEQRDDEALSTATGERQFLQNDELEQKLQQLEELAKLGSRAAAEQLLSELENLLDNLQVVQGQAGNRQGDERSDMQQNMDEIANMMRRQQEMMDETDRLGRQWRRGEMSDENYAQNMKDMARAQEELRGAWRDLQERLMQQNGGGEGMGEADTAMGQARNSLAQGEGEAATDSQARAIEAMRRSGQEMMQALRERAGEQAQSPNNLDPLGRQRQSGNAPYDSDVKIPSEVDLEQARRILDEIRARLEYLTPQRERQYLERLLNFN